MQGRITDSTFVRLILVACLVFSPVSTQGAETLNLGSQIDSNLRQDNVTQNFGNFSDIWVASQGGPPRNRRVVIQFDVAGLGGVPAGSSIKAAFMQMRIIDSEGPRNHSVHRILGDPQWTETGVTWSRRTATPVNWTTAGGDFFATAADTQLTTAGGTLMSWNLRTDGTIANIPQGWLDGTTPNRGLLLKDVAEGNVVRRRVRYHSKEAVVAGNRPALAVSYLRNITLGAVTPGISEVTWNWTFPTGSTAANYDGVLFAKKNGSGAGFTFNPSDGTAYAAGLDLGSSEFAVINTSAFTTVSATDENGADSVVLPATAYTYRAFNHDSTAITGAASVAAPHYALGVSGNATTITGGGTLKNWSYRSGAASLSPPALDPGNIVLAGSNDNKLHSMDANNGGRKYQPGGVIGITGGAIQSRPVLIPSIVTAVDCDSVTAGQQPCDVAYVGSGDGRVYAFRADTGAQLWQSAVLGTAIFGSPAVQLKAYTSPSYPHAFDLVIVGTRNTADTVNNKIYGLNGSTGAIVWTFAPGNLDIISSSPVVDYASNSVWLSSRAGAAGTQPSLWKLDTATTNVAGNLLNSVTLSSLSPANRHMDASPELNATATYLYAVTTGGDLVAVDHANPINVFTTNVGAFSGMGFPIILQGVTANDDDVYFSTSGGTHKRTFNRTAQTFAVAWDTTVATLGGNPSTPIFLPNADMTSAAVGTMYVGVSDGRLKKISLSTGALSLTRDINLGATIGDPSIDVLTNKLYVGDSSGRIYSFDIF